MPIVFFLVSPKQQQQHRIETRSANDILAEGHLLHTETSFRELKSRDAIPHEYFQAWIALGDSFAAGPGAGDPYDANGKWGGCMRGNKAYPNQLQLLDEMKGPRGRGGEKPKFNFAACTGDQTQQLLDFTKPDNQLRQIKRGETTFATLSIGGNDVRFSEILNSCVFGRKGNCDDKLSQAEEIMYNGSFHEKYNRVLTVALVEQFGMPERRPTLTNTLLYQQGYLQFFEETTDQCDGATFIKGVKKPKITRALRQSMNKLTHQLNYLVHYWVDSDWRYNNHRFCRPGVKEPKNDPETWFFHLPWVLRIDENDEEGILQSLDHNASISDDNTANAIMDDFTWTPELQDDPNKRSDSAWLTKTFHPKPDGFASSANFDLFKFYYHEELDKLIKKRFLIMCVGDYLSLGKNVDPQNPDRYGYVSQLHGLLRYGATFHHDPWWEGISHAFVGSRGDDYEGDFRREIYSMYDSIRQVTDALLGSPWNKREGGKIVPVMVGHCELMMGRNPEDIIGNVRYLLDTIWRHDRDAVVLLAQVPIIRTSATTNEHLQDDRQYLTRFGYHRIAWDFLEGIALASYRGFFEGGKWANANYEKVEPLPALPGPPNTGSPCIQKKQDRAPSAEDMKLSLFRGYSPADEDKWIAERACNDQVEFNSSNPVFNTDQTCVYAGGDSNRTTKHQLLVERVGGKLDVEDCKRSVKRKNGAWPNWKPPMTRQVFYQQLSNSAKTETTNPSSEAKSASTTAGMSRAGMFQKDSPSGLARRLAPTTFATRERYFRPTAWIVTLYRSMQICNNDSPYTFGATAQGDLGCVEYNIDISGSIHEGDPPWNQHIKMHPPPEDIRSDLIPLLLDGPDIVCSKERTGSWTEDEAKAAIEEYCGNDDPFGGTEARVIKGKLKISASYKFRKDHRDYDNPYRPENKDYCKTTVDMRSGRFCSQRLENMMIPKRRGRQRG
ncbi:hypothetical protein BCR34DRAFT_631030 [Clohesyomyces aquaticus]|uniref:SGNH hydrolase-type esterase domain-containing protein n=1 Tax=Clohesyomyces aquaticus TaxID=1231657 RepID=A0A1Y1ZBK7_9PLEO|nr:hypothetical protein BCR34DRAFT_631030 [Clohesyomyces aquaticus]